jgi:hypothetical protein
MTKADFEFGPKIQAAFEQWLCGHWPKAESAFALLALHSPAHHAESVKTLAAIVHDLSGTAAVVGHQTVDMLAHALTHGLGDGVRRSLGAGIPASSSPTLPTAGGSIITTSFRAPGRRIENMIKEHKLYLTSGRPSCPQLEANQFRLFLRTSAYWLMLDLRTAALNGLVIAQMLTTIAARAP